MKYPKVSILILNFIVRIIIKVDILYKKFMNKYVVSNLKGHVL